MPDALWRYAESGAGLPYADNQAEDMIRERGVMDAFDGWTDVFADHVRGKGKVPPGRWRAYGYEPPRKGFADLRLALRDRRMRLGVPPEGSSPDVQQRLGLNRDATLSPGRSEAERNSG